MFGRLEVLTDNWLDILNGVWLTIFVWIVSMVFAMALGLLFALAKLYGPAPIRWLVRAMDVTFRGVPFLIVLFLLYYGGPFVGLALNPLPAGIISLSIYSSAYFGEIFRSGLLSVPKGQIEAARMFGLNRSQTFWDVSLPQMMIVIFPALVNMSIILVKETAVVSVITVPELTATLSTLGSITFSYVPTLTLLALFYWVLLELVSFGGARVERRLSRYLTF